MGDNTNDNLVRKAIFELVSVLARRRALTKTEAQSVLDILNSDKTIEELQNETES